MNVTLSVLNVAALVALVTFHFQDDGMQTQTAAIQQPHHLLQQAPQLAIMNQQRSNSTMLATDSNAPGTATQSTARWVF
jgi:hypothetical protein